MSYNVLVILFAATCVAAASGCLVNQVACGDGRCVSSSYWCDGISDCNDGSDEQNNACKLPASLRFSNSRKLSGRLEIRHGGVWGTICKTGFGDKEAQVACRMMNLTGGRIIRISGSESTDMPVWLDRVDCEGSEDTLEQCSMGKWGYNYCLHSDDVAINCDSRPTPPPQVNEKTLQQKLPATCGSTFGGRVKRIVDGRTASRSEVPWQASIRIRGGSKGVHKCGAVIISDELLLTAAHCLHSSLRPVLRVRVGDYHLSFGESSEEEFKVEKFVVHPDYMKRGSRPFNDIAMLKIKPKKGRKITFGRYVQPVCLPNNSTEYTTGKVCTISGWGKTNPKDKTATDTLRVAKVPIVSQAICTQQEVLRGNVVDGMFCAGELDGTGADACQGDSGGPITCQDNGVDVLYGLTSWGISCGKENKPGVYAKLTHYLDWIHRQIVNL